MDSCHFPAKYCDITNGDVLPFHFNDTENELDFKGEKDFLVCSIIHFQSLIIQERNVSHSTGICKTVQACW